MSQQLLIEWTSKGTNLVGALTATFTPDPAISASWGIRRTDTLAEVVPSGTPLETDGAGRFWYYVTEPELGLRYEFWLRVTDGANTVYVHEYATGTPWWNVDGSWGSCKKWYVEESGRNDRVRDAFNNDYTDVSCNRVGNASQKWLDRQLPFEKSKLWFYYTLPANATMITFEKALYVDGVYLQDNDNPDSYGAYPRYALPWSTLRCGLVPQQQDETALTLTDAQGIVFGDGQWAVNAIYLTPSDEERRIVVLAGSYSPTLVLDSDVTFWTYNYPELLVTAMMRQDEVFEANTTRTNDYENVLKRELLKIYHWYKVNEWNSGPTGRRLIG